MVYTYDAKGTCSRKIIIDDENGEQVLAEVEDDSLLKKLADSFEARFEDMYGHNENTENF